MGKASKKYFHPKNNFNHSPRAGSKLARRIDRANDMSDFKMRLRHSALQKIAAKYS